MLNGHTIDNTCIVTDYDRCITTGEPGATTAFSVFSTSPHVPKILTEERKGLFEYYRPIETNTSMDRNTWQKHMIDWHHKAIGVFQEHLTRSGLDATIEHAIEQTQIRGGFTDFLGEMKESGVPILLFSAGITNIIEHVLEHNNIPYDGIYGNKLCFDEKGKCTGITDRGVFIGKKNWESIPEDRKEIVSGRTHEILLGDSLEDILMSDPEKNTTSIGFLLSEHAQDLEAYQSTFDHIVDSDTNDNSILKTISDQLQQAA